MTTRGMAINVWMVLAVLLLAAMGLAAAYSWAPDKPVQELAPRWAPPPSVFIDVKGLKVHMRDQGRRDDPVPIVLLHGTSSSLHTWEGWVAALQGERRVITMDLPGFGLTGPTAQDDYSNEAYTRFVLDFLDATGVQRCVLGGNSLGGEIAWNVALAAPERVQRLILVDAAGYPFQPKSLPIGFRLALNPVSGRVMEAVLPRAIVADSVRNVYGDPSRVTPALVDRYEQLTLRAGNRHALVRRFQQRDMGAGARRIAGISAPTLILWGGRDRLIPLEIGRNFRRDIAGSELIVFDDLGHVPHEEDPTRTVAAVQAFLKR